MTTRIHFSASQRPVALEAGERMMRRYGQSDLGKAEVIVALGGDGWMLETLRGRYADKLPVYGMHRGTVGFLMNEYSPDDLHGRLSAAQKTVIHPLLMRARDAEGRTHKYHAFNEVSLFRQTSQAAHLRILVDGEVRPRMVTTLGGSFDHRVVDGDVVSRFVADVASVMEEPALLLD